MDGRRRKGDERRRELREATMRVIARGGIAAVTQRAVAAEAGLTPSLVSYHFPTVDALLSATLAAVNDAYVAALGRCARDADPVPALAALVAQAAGSERGYTVDAEYELFLQAGRRPALREEWSRWTGALDALLAPLVPEPARRAGVGAAVDGLFLRCWCDPVPWRAGDVETVLRALLPA
ncbi:TetR family transcriptional regulator [Actinomycetospora sp. NBRC 106375]|uniref:TetR/AcrR family transcriptional regulator n=1 Tax=Actinomycetospora sp. NBRC 106375 TaxID=3032207 RepID=UPI0024A46035|nr:TetR family transcriptional regulator [Actinomycetospora sp. NBRC 106375]GLZ47716.1 TetR family transcriptional regulator [Actinomycetospora sp. NBRC 106375]